MTTKPEFHYNGTENQLWLEEWLKYRLKYSQDFVANLDKSKIGLTNLNLTWMKLKGKFVIENFPDLVTLNLGENELKEIEIKNCPKLEEVIVSHNYLKDLKIESCPEITDLYTTYNELTKLEVSELKKLEVLGYDCEEKSCSKKPCLCKSNASCHCNKFSGEEKKKLDTLTSTGGIKKSRSTTKKRTTEFKDKNFFIDNNEIEEIDLVSEKES